MDYLYERRDALKRAIKKWEKQAFKPGANQVLSELRARLNEIERVIVALEHEV